MPNDSNSQSTPDAPSLSPLGKLDMAAESFLRSSWASAVAFLRSSGLISEKTAGAASLDVKPVKPSGWTPSSPSPRASASEDSRVPEDAFTSPFYPLKGPPSTPKEKLMLQEAQEKDKAELQSGFLADSNALRRMNSSEAAEHNCVDLEFLYRSCLHRGTIWERMKGCAEFDRNWKDCVARQGAMLEEMGFGDKRRSGEELQWILEKVDSMWLRERREKEMNAATEGKGSEKSG